MNGNYIKYYSVSSLTGIIIMISGLILSGCVNKFVHPSDIPSWLVNRQLEGVEKDYQLTVDEAERKVAQAIAAIGGRVRYVTLVGESRTMYAFDSDGETIVVDIDPYRNRPGYVEIDINVSLYGDSVRAERIFQNITATPVGK